MLSEKLRNLLSQLEALKTPQHKLTERDHKLREQLNSKFAEILQKKGI